MVFFSVNVEIKPFGQNPRIVAQHIWHKHLDPNNPHTDTILKHSMRPWCLSRAEKIFRRREMWAFLLNRLFYKIRIILCVMLIGNWYCVEGSGSWWNGTENGLSNNGDNGPPRNRFWLTIGNHVGDDGDETPNLFLSFLENFFNFLHLWPVAKCDKIRWVQSREGVQMPN